MSRKNLSDVQAQDLLLKWRYEGVDGHDVYDIHAVRDFKVGAAPLGQFTYNPRTGNGWAELRADQTGTRLQALGPEGAES